MEKSQKPLTISEYIESARPVAQPHLKALYSCLKEAAPDAGEGIKWRAPAFTCDTVLFTFAAFKKHLNFYPTPSAIRNFAAALDGIETGKSSVKFPYDKELPISLIRKIAEFRIHDVKVNRAKWM